MNNSQPQKTWLKNDGKECLWVRTYLDRKIKDTTLGRYPDAFRSHDKESTDETYIWAIEIVLHLDENGESKLVSRLKNALRQKRMRSNPDKKPYSFILPISTKKHLSAIAKKHKKTENEIIIDLINDAKQFNQDILDLEIKAANQRKKLQEIKYDKAMQEINRLATLLSKWELSMGTQDPEYEGEQDTLQAETEKKTKAIQDAISYTVKCRSLMQPRIQE